MADFFTEAPAIEAPVAFTGWVVWDRLVVGLGILVFVFVGGMEGGTKRLERSRSRRWRHWQQYPQGIGGVFLWH
jgi:hypothetical protein